MYRARERRHPAPGPDPRAAAMLSPVPHADLAPFHLPTTSPAPPHGQRRRPVAVLVDDRQHVRPVFAGGRRPVTGPDASPRSVTNSPVNRNVIQSCGRTTCASLAQLSGSLRCNQLSLLIVNAATGTLPTAAAQSAAPPASCLISHPASGAVSVSFHNFAGRTTSRSLSRTTIPCCCPATLIASTRGRAGRRPRCLECAPPCLRILFGPRRRSDRVGCRSRGRQRLRYRDHAPRPWCSASTSRLRQRVAGSSLIVSRCAGRGRHARTVAGLP